MATKIIKALVDGAVQEIEVEAMTSGEQPLSYDERLDILEDKPIITDGNLLVGNGTVELEEMTPEEVLSHINGASVMTMTTEEYEAISDDDANANTLYLLTDSEEEYYTKDEADEKYESKTDASAKLTEAKEYADAIKNDLLNGAGEAYDTLKELGELIDDNKDAIDVLEEVASGKADAEHSHDASDITGTLPIANGGTGATDAATARANLGVNIPTYTTFAQLGLTANCTTAEVFAAMPVPSMFVYLKNTISPMITDLPHTYCLVEIIRNGVYGVARCINVNTSTAIPYEASLWYNYSTSEVVFSGWKQANTTYALSKDGTTITLTGSDGSTSTVEDSTSSSTSSGLNVEFAVTGSYTTYTCSTNNAKFYTITYSATTAGVTLYQTGVIDYQALKVGNTTTSTTLHFGFSDSIYVSIDISVSSKAVTFAINSDESSSDGVTFNICQIRGYY